MTDRNEEMLAHGQTRHAWRTPWGYAPILSLIACAALPLQAAGAQLVEHSTPSYVSTAKNLGATDPTTTIDVSIWLRLHNRDAMDVLARQLYDPASPNYRHWLKPADITARFAPTAQEAQAVQQFFVSHNLKVVTVGPNNFFVRARGTVGDIQKAFHVQLNNYDVRGTTMRAPAGDPSVDAPAAGLVRAIAGLDSGAYSHPLVSRAALSPGGQARSANQPNASPDFFPDACFTGPKTEKYGASGTFPSAVYKGNGYDAGCGYTPPDIATAYNLTGLYAEGFDGTGQTISIIDWCGSPTIMADANAFSKKYKLPQFTSSNFSILEVPVPSECAGEDPEINIDVEWAHAVAPGASINLVVPPSASFQDVDEATFYIVNYATGNVISGSYGAPEAEVATATLDTESMINQIAAMTGISANYATGDNGDFTTFGISATVNAPSDGPYATAVGGVSVALNSDKSIAWQAGWGTNEVLLTDAGSIFDPPLAFGFVYGAGGGPSAVFPKPAYQSALPGSQRLLPDISWVADPFTGVAILITVPGQFPPQTWLVYGGTSVATPMFSGLWAIANQEAGAPLGLAANYVYTLPAGAVTDIVPFGSKHNDTAVIQPASGTTDSFSPGKLMGGATMGKFYSALYDYPFQAFTTYALSFGTDCTAAASGFGTLCTDPLALKTVTGWDNITGVGVPNAQAFADSFKQ